MKYDIDNLNRVTKADEGTTANDDGLKHKFAQKVTLVLSGEEIRIQLEKPEEKPERKAIVRSRATLIAAIMVERGEADALRDLADRFDGALVILVSSV